MIHDTFTDFQGWRKKKPSGFFNLPSPKKQRTPLKINAWKMVPQKILGANKNLRKSGRALNTSHQLGHEQPGVADFLFQSADSVEPKKNPRYLALTVGRGAGVWPIGGMGLWDGWWFRDSGFQGWILDFIRLLKIFWQERIVRSVVPCPQWRTRYCRFFDWDGNVIPMTSVFFCWESAWKMRLLTFLGGLLPWCPAPTTPV